MTNGQDDCRTLRIAYRITAVDFGPTGLIYRCKAIKRAPAGWSAMALTSDMVPAGIVAGDTIEVTALERRRRILRIFPTIERSVGGVRRA